MNADNLGELNTNALSGEENLSEADRAFANPDKFNLLADEEYLAIPESEFRARFRERLHHTLEIQTYHAIHNKKNLPASRRNTAERLLGLWDRRGLAHDLPEYVFARKLLEFADELIAGRRVDLSPYAWHELTQAEQDLFAQVVHQRRSVRHWDAGREVPRELIHKLLDAGLWAAHSCNLQSVRYIVVRESVQPGLFIGSDIPGGPVHIVLLQDERVYRANPNNPVKNRLLDCGAAAQNIVLAAHAYGLGGCWLTFSEGMLARLRKKFALPEYISPVTYVDVGWPVQMPFPVQRIAVAEALLAPL
ncbi:MAG: nitroreductase family protein [Desulfarculales bacterium]|jgi:nitroreductase|nr:nitroreductase family protein [Desulfarculales bacterium]